MKVTELLAIALGAILTNNFIFIGRPPPFIEMGSIIAFKRHYINRLKCFNKTGIDYTRIDPTYKAALRSAP